MRVSGRRSLMGARDRPYRRRSDRVRVIGSSPRRSWARRRRDGECDRSRRCAFGAEQGARRHRQDARAARNGGVLRSRSAAGAGEPRGALDRRMRIAERRLGRRLHRGAGGLGRRQAETSDGPLAAALSCKPGRIRIRNPSTFDFSDRFFARHNLRIDPDHSTRRGSPQRLIGAARSCRTVGNPGRAPGFRTHGNTALLTFPWVE
jgi:hypothetical protein